MLIVNDNAGTNQIQLMQRQSNIELLRIIAMLMILVLHANMMANGLPSSDEVMSDFLPSFFRFFFEVISIVGVNVFVLISGWFGLRCTKRGVCNIFFQCAFCSGVAIVIYLLLHHSMPIWTMLIKEAYIGSSYWFVVSYLGLMIMAPVLNTFVEHTSKMVLERFLVVFFAFQMVYGWLMLDEAHFINGNSILSFIGIYLLARYLKLYGKPLVDKSSRFFFCGYALCSIVVIIFLLAGILSNNVLISQNIIDKVALAYNSPFVIVSSVCLFLGFVRLDMGSHRRINRLAASAFSIYLIHCNIIILPDYIQLMSSTFEKFDGILCIFVIFAMLLVIGAACILIDQVRVWCWKKIVG